MRSAKEVKEEIELSRKAIQRLEREIQAAGESLLLEKNRLEMLKWFLQPENTR